jgi:uncharacterized protein with HEPN domain
MSDRGSLEYLADIREAIVRIQRYTEGLRYEEFLLDLKSQDAVVRNLQILGEAVKHLPAQLTEKHQHIEWSKIAGLRDRLVHHYFGVNWDIVWDVIATKLGPLLEQIDALLRLYRDSHD